MLSRTFLILNNQVFVNLPNFYVGKKFDPRNTGSMPMVKIVFRLEFEQIF